MTKIGNILEKNNIAMYISCVFISLIKIIHTEKIGWHLKMSLNFDIIFLFVDLSLKDKRNHKFISDFWFLIKLECLNSNPNIEQTLLRKCLEFVTECTLHKRTVLNCVEVLKDQFNLLKVQKRMKNLGKEGIQ